MAPTLYMAHRSAPCRSVLITAKAIGLTLNEQLVDIKGGDLLKPDFLKINPQHTAPTLVEDDGFIIWESHAIITYLVSKYAKSDALYPSDLKKRALINQRLYFNGGVATAASKKIARPFAYDGKTSITQEDIDSANEVYEFLESFLDGKEWIAGDSVTIADYSLIATVSNLILLVAVDTARFPRVAEWVKKCEGLPEYQANVKGLKEYDELIRTALNSVSK